MQKHFHFLLFTLVLILFNFPASAQLQKKFSYLDVFQLEYTGDPQISSDGHFII